MKYLSSLTLLSCVIGSAFGLHVSNIAECPSLAPRASPPKDAHDLRPDDIKVVMALGDSITAAYGAKGLEGREPGKDFVKDSYEHRGVSFSIGGEEGAVTLPNLIKQYRNNSLPEGASTGDHFVHLCYG
jgi:phospholipase B1